MEEAIEKSLSLRPVPSFSLLQQGACRAVAGPPVQVMRQADVSASTQSLKAARRGCPAAAGG